MKTSKVLEDIIAQYGATSSKQKGTPRPCRPASLSEGLAGHSPDQIESEVTELLSQHAAALSRYAAALTPDKAIVQDGIQEAFLRFFITRAQGQHIENPRAWLFRVLRNFLFDCSRKSHSMQVVSLEHAVGLADFRQDVEEGYQQSEVFRCALALLSPREKECLQLRLEGFGYGEIAQILQIRPGTVGALLERGLRKIRKTGLLSRRQPCLDLSGK
jgi:RNA polymerase sigma factor (sigma-70 family)